MGVSHLIAFQLEGKKHTHPHTLNACKRERERNLTVCPLGEEDSFGFSSFLLHFPSVCPFFSFCLSSLCMFTSVCLSPCLSLSETFTPYHSDWQWFDLLACQGSQNRSVLPWAQVCWGPAQSCRILCDHGHLEHRLQYRNERIIFFPLCRTSYHFHLEWDELSQVKSAVFLWATTAVSGDFTGHFTGISTWNECYWCFVFNKLEEKCTMLITQHISRHFTQFKLSSSHW